MLCSTGTMYFLLGKAEISIIIFIPSLLTKIAQTSIR